MEKMNDSLSQGEVMMSKADAVSSRSLMISAVDNSKKQKDIYGKQQAISSSLYAMQKMYQAMLANTTALQAPVIMNQTKPNIIVIPQALYHFTSNLPAYFDFVAANKDPSSKLTINSSVTNKVLMIDSQAKSIAKKNLLTRQSISRKGVSLVVSKNNISHTNNSLDHQGPLNRFTQKRNATKLIESNKKQVSDSSHSLTLQVASLHDHIQAQSIKAKLNSKGSEPC